MRSMLQGYQRTLKEEVFELNLFVVSIDVVLGFCFVTPRPVFWKWSNDGRALFQRKIKVNEDALRFEGDGGVTWRHVWRGE
jgi:hypothetical protein